MRVEELDHLGVLTGHLELTRLFAQDETYEAVVAIWRASSNALVATNGKFNAFGHVTPFTRDNYARWV